MTNDLDHYLENAPSSLHDVLLEIRRVDARTKFRKSNKNSGIRTETEFMRSTLALILNGVVSAPSTSQARYAEVILYMRNKLILDVSAGDEEATLLY